MTAAKMMRAIQQSNHERSRLLGVLSAFQARLQRGSLNCWLCSVTGKRLQLLHSGYPVLWMNYRDGVGMYAIDNLTGHGVVLLGRTAKIQPGEYRVIFAGVDYGVP